MGRCRRPNWRQGMRDRQFSARPGSTYPLRFLDFKAFCRCGGPAVLSATCTGAHFASLFAFDLNIVVCILFWHTILASCLVSLFHHLTTRSNPSRSFFLIVMCTCLNDMNRY